MVDRLPFLSDEFHIAIASVSARSAQLEHHLELSIAHLLNGRPKTAEALLKSISADRAVDLYQALLLDEMPDAHKPISSLIKLIKLAKRERNEILHWIWGKVDENGIAENVSWRPFRDKKSKYRTAESVVYIADVMLDLVKYMHDWQMIIDQRRAPSLDTLEPPTPLGRLASLLAQDHEETDPPQERPQDSSQG